MDKPRSFLSYNIGYLTGIFMALANPQWWVIILAVGATSALAAIIEDVRSDDQNWGGGYDE